MVVSTGDIPPAERFAFWRDVTSRMLAPVDVRSESRDEFQGSAHLKNLGVIQVSEVTCSSYEAFRTAKMIRQSDPELYQLSLNLTAGQSGVLQGRQEATLGPRSLVLYDTSRPFHGWARPDGRLATGVMVAFPRALLPLSEKKVARLLAVRLPGDSGIGSLVCGLLLDLARQAKQFTAADATRVSAILLDLVGAMLARHMDAEPLIPPKTYQRVLMSRIHAFIQQRLGDPALSPSEIAAAHHISTRYLHKLFQKQGLTVAGWVRKRRLDGARRDLADPMAYSLPIGVIASRWGFSDSAHFSRVFSATYGVPPGTYRRLLHQSATEH